MNRAENARIFVLADFIPDFADFIVAKVLITYSDFPVLDEKVEHNGRFGVIGHSGCFSG